jgi:hypothetical protein
MLGARAAFPSVFLHAGVPDTSCCGIIFRTLTSLTTTTIVWRVLAGQSLLNILIVSFHDYTSAIFDMAIRNIR